MSLLAARLEEIPPACGRRRQPLQFFLHSCDNSRGADDRVGQGQVAEDAQDFLECGQGRIAAWLSSYLKSACSQLYFRPKVDPRPSNVTTHLLRLCQKWLDRIQEQRHRLVEPEGAP